MSLDVLAIGAHPDDVELGLGGTLLRMVKQDAKVGILDLTEGELASRGTDEERREEAQEAAKRLGVALRENAKLPDGDIANVPEQRQAVVAMIRRLRPSVVIHHHPVDRHPDHEAAHVLVRDAIFLSGVTKFPGGDPHRPNQVLLYHPYGDYDGQPTWIIDIGDFMDEKMRVLEAHRSQLYNPEYEGPETYVSSQAFWEGIRIRAAYWGLRVGAAFGEPLHASGHMVTATLPGLE